MKRLCALLMLLFLVITLSPFAFADPIAILSSDYHIWGDWKEQLYYKNAQRTQIYTGSFSTIESTPNSVGDPIGIYAHSEPFGFGATSSQISPFKIAIDSYAVASGLPKKVGEDFVYYQGSYIKTYATAVWKFSSTNSMLDIVLSGAYKYNYK